jgi:hypothetical protein
LADWRAFISAMTQSSQVALSAASQHTAVTRYRYFSCLGTVFLHRLFLELFLGQALCRLHRQERELK